MLNLVKAEQIAIKAVTQAGDFLKKYQTKVIIEKQKDIVDVQTNADLQAEQICIKTIQKTYPNHNILSEEIGLIDHQSEYTWVIDPLDGTKEYLRKQSTYLSLISLEDKKKLLVGAVYEPSTQDIYHAASNKNSYKNKQKLQVSTQSNLSNSIISTYLPNNAVDKKTQTHYWDLLRKTAFQTYRLRSSHFNCLDLCYVAQAAYEAHFILPNIGPDWYDISSGILIAQQAGAKITDTKGNSIKNQDLSNGLVASNGLIHDQLLTIINS